MKRYRVDAKEGKVFEVECEKYDYPHVDSDGKVQYRNTHFDDEGAAWFRLVCECEARVNMAASERYKARERFEKATSALADASEALQNAKELQKDYLARSSAI